MKRSDAKRAANLRYGVLPNLVARISQDPGLLQKTNFAVRTHKCLNLNTRLLGFPRNNLTSWVLTQVSQVLNAPPLGSRCGLLRKFPNFFERVHPFFVAVLSEDVMLTVFETKDTTAIAPRQKVGLDISPADDGYIIYEAENDKVHFLNPTAVLILELCDGSHSASAIAEMVQEGYGLPAAPVQEVQAALTAMRTEGLIVSEERA